MAGSKTIACRVSDNLKNRFDRESRMRDITLAKVVEAFTIASENDEIDIVDGCFYSKEPTIENRADRNWERFKEVMTEKGYFDSDIERASEQILEGGRSMPKRGKRSRVSDTGC